MQILGWKVYFQPQRDVILVKDDAYNVPKPHWGDILIVSVALMGLWRCVFGIFLPKYQPYGLFNPIFTSFIHYQLSITSNHPHRKGNLNQCRSVFHSRPIEHITPVRVYSSNANIQFFCNFGRVNTFIN